MSLRSASIATLLAASFSTAGIAGPLCPGLSGQARKTCLQDQAARDREQVRKADRNAKILSALHRGACKGEKYVGVGVGAATGTVTGAVGGAIAYDTGKAIGRKIAGPDGC